MIHLLLISFVCFYMNNILLLPNATFKFLERHHCLISIFLLFFNLLPLSCYCYWNLSPVFPASSRWKSFLSTSHRWQGPLCSPTNKQFRSLYLFTPVMISPVFCFRVIVYFLIWIKSGRCSHLQAVQLLSSSSGLMQPKQQAVGTREAAASFWLKYRRAAECKLQIALHF